MLKLRLIPLLLVIVIVIVITFLITGLALVYYRNNALIIETMMGYRFNETTLPNIKDSYNYHYSNSDIVYFKNKIKQEQETVEQIKDAENNTFLRTPFQVLQTKEVDRLENVDINTQVFQIVRAMETETLPGFGLIKTDTQSIHDSNIQKTTRKDLIQHLQNVKASSLKTSIDDTITSIISYTKQLFGETEKNVGIVSNVLTSIKNRNAKVVTFNDTEAGVLQNVWENSNDNIKRQLINQLIDCNDSKGKLYCPTGTTTRIVESIYINDPESFPKTKRVLNEEMLQTASKLRQSNENLQGQDFKLALLEKFRQDYIIPEILTEKEVNDSVSEWIDYI
jgi:hypothetical protein